MEFGVRSMVILVIVVNCVVKDVDVMGFGFGLDQFWILFGFWIIDLCIFQQLFDFWVVFGFDFVIVGKIFFFVFVLVKLKFVIIKCVFVFVVCNIGDDCVDFNMRVFN